MKEKQNIHTWQHLCRFFYRILKTKETSNHISEGRMQLFSNPSWLRIAHRGERLQKCSWHFSTNPNDVQTGRADSKHRVVSINTHPGKGEEKEKGASKRESGKDMADSGRSLSINEPAKPNATAAQRRTTSLITPCMPVRHIDESIEAPKGTASIPQLGQAIMKKEKELLSTTMSRSCGDRDEEENCWSAVKFSSIT